MMLEWFNAREVSKLAEDLADQYAAHAGSTAAADGGDAAQSVSAKLFDDLYRVAATKFSGLRLNFYKKSKLANSFKWRLIENGVAKQTADEVTQRLVVHLAGADVVAAPDGGSDAAKPDLRLPTNARDLLAQADKCIKRAAYTEAVEHLQEFVRLHPRHAVALNNLGAALSKVGRYGEAQRCFREALAVDPRLIDAQSNLGSLLRLTGRFAEAESWLRSAIKLNPTHLQARNNLGLNLIFLGQLREAEGQFKKMLKLDTRSDDALYGLGLIAERQGNFREAESLFKRAVALNGKASGAWAGLAGTRKQTASDADWLKGAETLAEEFAASGISPSQEADLRFAMGKYWDDLGDFGRAFRNYQRGNELLKGIAEEYHRDARESFVDGQIKTYTREKLAKVPREDCPPPEPVFVIGMQRSGTSLAEQILASHPAVKGAGELPYWSKAALHHERAILEGQIDASTKERLAQEYLSVLRVDAGGARRVVDKSLVNVDYLGAIYSVLPNARIIHMQRDPVDTCLSCYFQQFAVSLEFAMDLEDLAHYYRQYQRLMAHWRSVLPPGAMLEVPYEGLVGDPESWSRKMLEFIGLDWDPQVLDFQATQRLVVTSSFWQVRQKIYGSSVDRWRNYKKYIQPLLSLR